MSEHEESRTERLNHLLTKIQERGLRMTPQRVAIIRALIMHPGHPTVDELHTALLDKFPSMSLATVYKTITLLKQMGEVIELEFSSRENRFDGHNPSPHPHLICTKCGAVVDPEVDGLGDIIKEIKNNSGFVLTSHRLDFYGLCPTCQRST